MPPTIKAPFAKRADGRIAHVSDVARGLACGCYCLHCDGHMIARQGQVMAHHFAHHGPDCGGGMTWLHRAGQEGPFIEGAMRRLIIETVESLATEQKGH